MGETAPMIVSHLHRFIFLKVNKTAGTSIEIALSQFCGPEDVITPISPEDEETRRALGHRGPQNGERFFNHVTAREVKAQVGDVIWGGYYKFCFERNPWDRVISLYYWRCKTEPRPTIAEFIASGAAQVLKRKGREVYTIDNQVAVDRVCRFENLADELEVVRTQLGLPAPLVLPHAKSQYRRDRRPYAEILTAEERALIADLFRDEIELLGYEF